MEKLEKEAIEILQVLCAYDNCVISDSGGKDSSVLKYIALKAREIYGLNFKVRHNHTTVDAPETVYFVREEKEKFEKMGIEYEISYPKETMWQLIVRHGTPPTRRMRYCCADLKENSGIGEKLVTGVRKAESKSRESNQGVITFTNPKKELKQKIKDNEDFKETPKGGVIVYNLDNDENRRIFELCYRTHKTLINPLLNWDDEFLWWYIKTNNIPLNPLYGCGQCRVGCIGCPMAGERRWKEFERYPKYKEAYIRAFDKMLIERERRGLKNRDLWKTGIKVFKWWMEDKNIDGQLAFGEDMEIYEAYTDYINFR
jgi:phosphoadenosine phosphosulfate reductase